MFAFLKALPAIGDLCFMAFCFVTGLIAVIIAIKEAKKQPEERQPGPFGYSWLPIARLAVGACIVLLGASILSYF